MSASLILPLHAPTTPYKLAQSSCSGNVPTIVYVWVCGCYEVKPLRENIDRSIKHMRWQN